MISKNYRLIIETFLLNSFWRALYIFNIFLWGLLGLQVVLLVFINSVKEIEIPELFKEQIIKVAEENQIVLDIESAKISLNAQIILKGIKARIIGTPENFLNVERINLKISLSELLYSKISILNLDIINAKLSSAITPKLDYINRFYANIKKEGEFWIVNAEEFRIDNFVVNIKGILNKNFKTSELLQKQIEDKEFETENTAEKEFDLKKEYIEISKYINHFRKYLADFESPNLDIYFKFYGGYKNSIKCNLIAEDAFIILDKYDIKTDQIKDFRIDYPRIKLDYISNTKGVSEIEIDSSIKSLQTKDFPKINGLYAKSNIKLEDKYISFSNISLDVLNLEYEGIKVSKVKVKKKQIKGQDFTGIWNLYFKIDEYEVKSNIDIWNEDEIYLKSNAYINPEIFFDFVIKTTNDDEEVKDTLKMFTFEDGLNIYVDGYYNLKTKLIQVKSMLQADNAKIMDIPTKYLNAQIDYDSNSNEVILKDAHVITKEGWQINANISQNLENLDYSFYIDGTIKPMDIAHFMAPWWTNIFKDFNFGGAKNFPEVDISISSRWGKPEYIWCFGKVDGKNAIYKGSEFDKFSTYLWINPKKIQLYQTKIIAEDRVANVMLEWVYEDGITSYMHQNLDIKSTLNSAELIALGGEDAQEILDVVKFKEAPHLKLDAILYNPAKEDKAHFNAEIFASGETTIEGVRVYNLDIEAVSDRINTKINNARFTFCGGEVEGNIDLIKVQDDMQFKAQLNAKKIDQNEFFNFFDEISNKQKVEDKKEDSKQEKSIGYIDINTTLSGNVSEIEYTQGSGYVNLENEDLIELHIFGLLSRALSAIKLPFGSFDLENFNGAFTLKDGKIEFPNMVLSGPVMKINGNSTYNYIKDELEAKLFVKPFASMELPLVSNILNIINPLDFIVVDLSGKLDDPNIKIRANLIKEKTNRKSDKEEVDIKK